MIRLALIILAIFLGMGEPLEAQNRPGQQRGPDPGPVHMLLQLRTELELTPAQVTQLEQIDAEMDRLNEPLVTRLSQIRGKIRQLGSHETMGSAQRASFDAYMAEARPLWGAIQENIETAGRQVGAVLTRKQKERVARLLRETRNNRERSDRPPQPVDGGN